MKKAMQKNNSGSILVYTLIILFIVIISAVGIAAVSVIDMKTSRTTDDSTSAFQIADSAVEMALRETMVNENDTIGEITVAIGGACDDIVNPYGIAIVSGNLNGEVDRPYKLSFYKNDGSEKVITSCADTATLTKVKASGTYSGTGRSIEVDLPDFCRDRGEISYWEMNDGVVGDETSAVDLITTTNANDGTLGDGVCAPPGDIPCPDWIDNDNMAPVEDLALDFSGAEYVEVADDASLDFTDAISISAWFKMNSVPAAAGDFNGLIMKSSDDNWSDGYGIFLQGNGTPDPDIKFYIDAWNGSISSETLTTPLAWHHVVGTYQKNSDGTGVDAVKMYIDGSPVATQGMYAGDMNSTTTSLYMGAAESSATPPPFTPGHFFDGMIDKVRIYDCALTSEEIVQLNADESP